MTETLAERIKRLRTALGLTQAELAMRAGAPSGRAIVNSWESGTQPAAKWIPGLADALGVSCDELLKGKGPDTEE